MSEDILGLLDAVKNNRVKTNREMEKIRGDITLSLEGKRMKLENAYRDGVLEHKKLINRYKIAVNSLKEDVTRNIYLHPNSYGFNSDSQIKEMRELIEKSEVAFEKKEFDNLIERAMNMRDKSLIRALGSVAYTKKDYESLEKLKTIDTSISKVLDFEKGFGSLADANTKLELSVMLRGVEKPNDISQAVLNET